MTGAANSDLEEEFKRFMEFIELQKSLNKKYSEKEFQEFLKLKKPGNKKFPLSLNDNTGVSKELVKQFKSDPLPIETYQDLTKRINGLINVKNELYSSSNISAVKSSPAGQVKF